MRRRHDGSDHGCTLGWPSDAAVNGAIAHATAAVNDECCHLCFGMNELQITSVDKKFFLDVDLHLTCWTLTWMAADEHWINPHIYKPCNELFHEVLELELQQLLEQDLFSK